MVQPDGKIVIGGYFTTYVGNSRPRIARLNVNGSLDSTFIVGTGLNNYPLTMVAQPNGKILVGGAFTIYNGTTVNRLVRLNSDGSRDTGFTTGSGLSDIAYWSAFQPDGKLLIGSAATTYNGNSSYPYLVRLNGYDPNSLNAPSILGDTFCQGESISVNYVATGYYAVGNQFTAQLSDAAGSFVSPISIGTVTATDSGSI
ncbi:MAG TPA: delta-60 repeat domain-containing protein, partial [Flavobacterium sp.]|nr:delta-60 repeat domain-containing protein [Flavobacterium sp.]